MKLFLTSEAKHPDSVSKLREYVGGFENKKIIYIPTAMNGDTWSGKIPWDSWEEATTWKLFNSLGATITPFLLEDPNNSNFDQKLADADIVFFVGGSASYLMYWIFRTGLDEYLPKLLKNNKTVYVGSSAGSMIAAPTLDICEWYVGESERGAKYLPGLGLVDFDFYPHYDETNLEEIKKLYTGNKMYLVKNGEVIIVEDSVVRVLGEERIITKQRA